MSQQTLGGTVDFELYIDARVLKGQASCPVGGRLSELLNGPGVLAGDAKSDFLAFHARTGEDGQDAYQDEPNVYVRKAAIQFVSVSSANDGRGVGADATRKYPFVQKSIVSVTIQLPTYVVAGSIHCRPGHKIQDVFNDDRAFIPLTDVCISCDNQPYGSKPFIAVNKHQIIAAQDNRFASAPFSLQWWLVELQSAIHGDRPRVSLKNFHGFPSAQEIDCHSVRPKSVQQAGKGFPEGM